jgi:general secretion pathway protein J
MGFTLIEVTLAITLLALVTMILYGAFYLSQRAVEKGQVRAEEGQRLRAAGELLAVYIRSAYPYRFSLRDPAIFFSGEENRLEFISALSSGMGGRGMAKVTVSLADEADGFLTLEEEMPVRLSDQSSEGYRNGIILSRGISNLRIDYLDPQSKEERWEDKWDGKERRMLPRAVRISHRGRGEEVQCVFPIMMSVLAP